jgi:enoyl-CoA hydratase/carnithine racemase
MPTDDGPTVLIERDGDDLSLQLNRASNRNAINVEMRDALNEALQLVIADDSIRSVRLNGRGKCFSVGGDLSEFGTLPDPASAHAIRALTMPGRLLAQCADRIEVHVHGACIGSGVELPAFCKRVTAAKDTFFHMPELQFGLLPGGGGCVSIPRRIGRQRLAWWVLSGKRINAQTALAWGLVDAIRD